MRISLILISIVLSATILKDTGPVQNLPENADQIKSINTILNQWHQAAAAADFETYFKCMDEDAIYIGTDESEKWNRNEFMAFCKPYFDRGSAWDFKPFDREVYLNEQKNMAWFDEKLETWMGICRSSGVLVLSGSNWKIKHYQLSVTVPNEIVNDFIELVKNNKAKPKTD